MKTKVLFVATIAMLALALAVPAAAKGLYIYTFDENVKPFIVGSSDAGKLCSLEHQIEDPAVGDGPTNGYAALKLLPSSTESAVWMMIELDSAIGAEDVNITFDARNQNGCKSCMPVVYVGELPPVKASQFSYVASPKDPPLADKWMSYNHKVTIKTDSHGPVYVALGWRPGADSLKIAGAVAFDNINVTMAPQP
jgi:hypothetical protein